MRLPSIPAAFHALVLQLSESGKTSEEVAEILFREHRYETNARVVRRLVKRHRDERADVSKAVVRSQLSRYLLRNVDRHERVARKAGLLYAQHLDRAAELREEDPDSPEAFAHEKLALRAMDRQLKAAGAMLDFAGLNQPDQPGQTQSTQEARKALIRRIEQITAQQNHAPSETMQ